MNTICKNIRLFFMSASLLPCMHMNALQISRAQERNSANICKRVRTVITAPKTVHYAINLLCALCLYEMYQGFTEPKFGQVCIGTLLLIYLRYCVIPWFCFISIFGGHARSVRYCLETGLVNREIGTGRLFGIFEFPASEAARYGRIETLRVLAEYGADLSQKNSQGKILADYAQLHPREHREWRKRKFAVLQFLLEEKLKKEMHARLRTLFESQRMVTDLAIEAWHEGMYEQQGIAQAHHIADIVNSYLLPITLPKPKHRVEIVIETDEMFEKKEHEKTD